jgi:2-dehydro-3-deoxyphosphogluconate aldolase/(4S)-4-hydroxy-2-oxoglutarate aldolase
MAVVVIDRLEDALPTTMSLLEGGVRIIEVALRTEASYEALIKITEELPEMTAGAGTVINTEQVRQLSNKSVKFGVSPGTNANVLSAAKYYGLSFAPGIATPSDIEIAVSYGCKTLKFFPAEPIGAVKYLKSISSPYEHLGLKFIPLGGLKEDNFENYLTCKNVLAVGGSWMLKPDLITEGKWKQITHNAKLSIKKVRIEHEKYQYLSEKEETVKLPVKEIKNSAKKKNISLNNIK